MIKIIKSNKENNNNNNNMVYFNQQYMKQCVHSKVVYRDIKAQEMVHYLHDIITTTGIACRHRATSYMIMLPSS